MPHATRVVQHYDLHPGGVVNVDLPQHCRIVSVFVPLSWPGVPRLLVIARVDAPLVPHRFFVLNRSDTLTSNMRDMRHIGDFQLSSTGPMHHVFFDSEFR